LTRKGTVLNYGAFFGFLSNRCAGISGLIKTNKKAYFYMVEEKTIENTNTANEAPASDYLYLRSVNIKEYRTIKDCSVDF
jgi:hypothetical protein